MRIQTVRASIHEPCILGMLSKQGGAVLLGATALAVGLLFLGLEVAKPGRLTFLPGGITFLVGLALVAFPLALPTPIRRVQLSDDGITWNRDGREFSRPWNDIASVTRREIKLNGMYITRKVLVAFRGGPRLELDEVLSQYNQLATTIQEASAAHLLEEARATLDREGAKFGPVTLRREGVTMAGDFLSWVHIAQLGIHNGQLVIFPVGGQPRSTPLSDMPNYLIFIELVNGLGVPLQVTQGPRWGV